MSGVLVVSEGVADWFVANWLYEAVLSDIKSMLMPGATRSALEAGMEPNMKYLDLGSWSHEQISELLRAAEQAHAEAERLGPARLRDPSFYPAFLAAFGELLGLLQKHPALV
jgi:hypothetical protein